MEKQGPRLSPAWLLGAAGVGLLAREVWRRARETNLRGQVALVTGSSRGLGFLLARELAREGCRIILCAGAIAGALSKWGLDQADANYYGAEVERGGYFVAADLAGTPVTESEARDAFRGFNGRFRNA